MIGSLNDKIKSTECNADSSKKNDCIVNANNKDRDVTKQTDTCIDGKLQAFSDLLFNSV